MAPLADTNRAHAEYIVQSRIDAANSLLAAGAISDSAAMRWSTASRQVIMDILGEHHASLLSFVSAGSGQMYTGASAAERERYRIEQMQERIGILESCVDQLRIPRYSASSHQSGRPVAAARTVFIVHGHANPLKYAVAHFIDQQIDLGSLILHDQPNSGRTILEKFQDYAIKTLYAVVLMTADDHGAARSSDQHEAQIVKGLRSRARQNVVFELGFFLGALGRHRVAVLYEPGVERPSDIEGFAWIEADPGEAWRHKLRTELDALSGPTK